MQGKKKKKHARSNDYFGLPIKAKPEVFGLDFHMFHTLTLNPLKMTSMRYKARTARMKQEGKLE